MMHKFWKCWCWNCLPWMSFSKLNLIVGEQISEWYHFDCVGCFIYTNFISFQSGVKFLWAQHLRIVCVQYCPSLRVVVFASTSSSMIVASCCCFCCHRHRCCFIFSFNFSFKWGEKKNNIFTHHAHMADNMAIHRKSLICFRLPILIISISTQNNIQFSFFFLLLNHCHHKRDLMPN